MAAARAARAQTRRGRLAVGAAVVEELDDDDVPLGVAQDGRGRIVPQVVLVGDEILALLFFFRQPQLLAIGVDRFDDDLRIFFKVGSNDLLDGLDLPRIEDRLLGRTLLSRRHAATR
jgi:hypothetical protein